MNDADQRITVILANVHSLRPRAEVVASWEADITVLQETKLAPHAIGQSAAAMKPQGWSIKHGKPCQHQAKRKNVVVTNAANEANSGGVAVLTKQPLRVIQEDIGPLDR